MTPTQLALAWVIHHDQVMAIPKTSTRQHLLENMAVLGIDLDQELLEKLDARFPPPIGPEPLAML